VIVADLNKALYTGTLNGRINGYQVDSVGVFNLQSDFGLKTGPNGSFRLSGHVTALDPLAQRWFAAGAGRQCDHHCRPWL
jgi:hypothetical protein